MTKKEDEKKIKRLTTGLTVVSIGWVATILIVIAVACNTVILTNSQVDQLAKRFTVAGSEACNKALSYKSDIGTAITLLCDSEYRRAVEKSDVDIDLAFSRDIPDSLKTGNTLYTYMRDKVFRGQDHD